MFLNIENSSKRFGAVAVRLRLFIYVQYCVRVYLPRSLNVQVSLSVIPCPASLWLISTPVTIQLCIHSKHEAYGYFSICHWTDERKNLEYVSLYLNEQIKDISKVFSAFIQPHTAITCMYYRIIFNSINNILVKITLICISNPDITMATCIRYCFHITQLQYWF